MVFNGIILFLSAIVFFWLGVITFFIVRFQKQYEAIFHGVSGKGIFDAVEAITQRVSVLEKKEEILAGRLAKTEHATGEYVQRIGIVRFNPFSDTGGSQSFTLALLDGRDHGIVMTSLYARTGHRWYIKEIIGGKGKILELSKEEQEAIKKAKVVVS